MADPQITLETVRNRGFDTSYINEDGYIEVRCSQCESMVVNGIPIHEYGCPNEEEKEGELDESEQEDDNDRSADDANYLDKWEDDNDDGQD